MRLTGRTGADDRDLDAGRLVALPLHQAGRGLKVGRDGGGSSPWDWRRSAAAAAARAWGARGALSGLLSAKLAWQRPVAGQWHTVFSQGKCQFLPRAPIVRSPRDS